MTSSSSGTITPSFAILARRPAVPQPKSGALPVTEAARTLVTYCSSGTTSILIWTPLPLWASLKLSIIFAQTSPSEAASQLQCTISVVCCACGARPVSQKGVLAAAAAGRERATGHVPTGRHPHLRLLGGPPGLRGTALA